MFVRPPVDPWGIPIAVVVGFVAGSFLSPRASVAWMIVALAAALGIFVPLRPVLQAAAAVWRWAVGWIPWRLLRSRGGGDHESGET